VHDITHHSLKVFCAPFLPYTYYYKRLFLGLFPDLTLIFGASLAAYAFKETLCYDCVICDVTLCFLMNWKAFLGLFQALRV
jgi:hypothetical protein